VKTPLEVVNAAFDALNVEDWAGFAGFCDPVSLRAFKREILEEFGEYSGHWAGGEVDEEFEEDEDPELQAAIDHDLALMDEWFGPAHRVRSEFESIETVDELREMDPGRAFARWLQAKSRNPYRSDEPGEGEEWRRAGNSGSRKTTRAYQYFAVGSVLDSPDIAYVIYRNANSPNDIYPGVMDGWEQSVPADEAELARLTHYLQRPQVVTCRKQADGSWRLLAGRSLSLVGTLEVVEIRKNPDEAG
jgi:hypothetical protein